MVALCECSQALRGVDGSDPDWWITWARQQSPTNPPPNPHSPHKSKIFHIPFSHAHHLPLFGRQPLSGWEGIHKAQISSDFCCPGPICHCRTLRWKAFAGRWQRYYCIYPSSSWILCWEIPQLLCKNELHWKVRESSKRRLSTAAAKWCIKDHKGISAGHGIPFCSVIQCGFINGRLRLSRNVFHDRFPVVFCPPRTHIVTYSSLRQCDDVLGNVMDEEMKIKIRRRWWLWLLLLIISIVSILIIRRKFRSQTSDNMDRWKEEQGRGREKRNIRRKKSKKKEDADAWKGRKVAKHCFSNDLGLRRVEK